MSGATERCPDCNGLTYYVAQTGARTCVACNGTGVVPAGTTAARHRRQAWLKTRPRPLLPVRR